jgi:hypothetical protein
MVSWSSSQIWRVDSGKSDMLQIQYFLKKDVSLNFYELNYVFIDYLSYFWTHKIDEVKFD